MKKLLFIALMLSTSFVFAQQSSKENMDVKAIKDVIQTAYVEGLQNEGDLEKIDSGFHPSFELIGIGKNGEVWELPIYSWKQRTKARKEKGAFPKTGKDKVTIKFLDVDVTGTAAVAKFEFMVGGVVKYVDYLSLYKFDKKWMIVSKIYYQFPEKK